MSDQFYGFYVERGDTIRLPTAGKYCDRDIYVSGIGSEDGYADVTGVTASPDDVLNGKKFVTANGDLEDGAMPIAEDVNLALKPKNSSFKIPKGYHSGNGNVTVSYDQLEITPKKEEQTISDREAFYANVKVNPIPDEYIIPSGTKDITENGTHDVTEFASVNVSVESGSGSEDLNDVLTEQEALIAELKEVLAEKSSGGTPTPTQEKTIDITTNGPHTVTPDEGYALSKVTANVNVPSEAPNIQPLEITENGTYTAPDGVDGYSPITVNVESSGGGSDEDVEIFVDLIENSATVFESDRITKLAQYAFAYRTKLQSISLPNLKSSNTRAFTNCESLVSLSIPNMTGYTYQYMAAYCGALKTADVKQASYISSYSFYSCANLTEMEFNRVSTIATNAFNGCTKLATLILRSDSLVTLGGTSAFTGTKIAGSGGYIYVPSALVDSYKAAANWSNYSAKIRAIEDYPEITGG